LRGKYSCQQPSVFFTIFFSSHDWLNIAGWLRKIVKRVLITALLALALENSSAQTYTVLHAFTNGPDGKIPNSTLVTNSGAVFGSTSSLFKINPDGSGFTVVSSLSGTFGRPTSIISAGNLFYGATLGSVPQTPNFAFAFKIGTNGTGFANTTNLGVGLGANDPSISLLAGDTLFGTSYDGGTSHNGTVFALNTNSTSLTILKSFSALVSKTNSDGAFPAVALVQSGNALFGTTYGGGLAGQGVVFCVTNDGSGSTVLKSFSALLSNNNADGAAPVCGLVLNGSTLFGATSAGGSSGNGVVFKLNTDGTGFTVLKTFSGTISGTNSDGAYPNGMVLNGRTIYGTTQHGGLAGSGVVFSMDTNGTGFTVLKNFGAAGGSSPSDGANPTGGLLLIRSTLYGTTQSGGTNSQGVLFSLTAPPEILATDGNFGVRTNVFGFDYTGVYGQSTVVEAATNLSHPSWIPLATNTLGTDPVLFQDSKWTLFPNRFYRVRGQ
jgi:uncharacterized repeat protein (TIGR03803 family)